MIALPCAPSLRPVDMHSLYVVTGDSVSLASNEGTVPVKLFAQYDVVFLPALTSPFITPQKC